MKSEGSKRQLHTCSRFAAVAKYLGDGTLPVRVSDARERPHQLSNVRGDRTLLNIPKVVHPAHAVHVSEVVVWGEFV